MPTTRLLAVLALTAACSDGDLRVVNVEPQAEIMSPNSEEVTLFEGISETFRGRVQDPDNRPEDLLASWWIGQTEICPPAPPTANNETFCDITLEDGNTEVRLLVTDRGGLGGEDVKVFWARPSAEPIAIITSLDPTAQYFADQPITFEGTVEDIEDSPSELEAWWTSSLDGDLSAVEASPSDSGRVNGIGFLSEGDHQIRLYVRDRAGNETYDTEVVRVGPANRPPDCGEITNPPDGGVERSEATVFFTGTVTDPDVPANELSVVWTSDKDGVIGESVPTSDGQIEFPFGGLSTDTHIITMTATDAFGQTCTVSNVLIVDSPPVVTLLSPQPNEVFEAGQPIVFSATAIDAEDSEPSLDVTWETDLSGVISSQSPGTDGSMSFPLSNLPVGRHSLSLTVADNSQLDTQVQVSFSINALPSAPGIEIAPEDPLTDDDLAVVITAEAVDPDNDPITYTYRWFLNGVEQLGNNTPNIPRSSTQRGDVWRVEVYASDAYGSGPTNSRTITVGNTAPELNDAAITGSPFFETSTMTCVPGLATDADGDTVSYSYSWQVNGTPIPGNANTIDGSSFSRDDEVECIVTPTDGTTGGSQVASAPVTVLNTPPSVANASVTPDGAEADATLTCAFDYTDDDGDVDVSDIIWRIGALQVGTGPTLSGAFDVGDVVVCSVTAGDGDANGNTITDNTTIRPSAPTIDGVDITPSSPSASDTLTCSYSGYSDPQGDPDQSRYRWEVNGLQVGSTNTLSTNFAKDDVVACFVIPSDGDNDGAELDDSVNVQNSPPTAPVLDIDPAFPLAGLDDVVCSIRNQASDADGDSLTYQFSWTRDGSPVFVAVDEETQSTFPAAEFSGLEELECTVTAFDGADSGAPATISLTTLPSIDPKLATGGSHTCVLNRRGEVVCWGLDQDGRTNAPPDIFLDLDGGLNYTCGIVEDSTLDCWGNLESPLNSADLRAPTGTFTNVSAGDNVACATPSSGGVLCWGDDTYGQVSEAPGSGQFTDVAVGFRHVCGLRSEGVVCWGDNTFAQHNAPSGSYSRLAAGSLHNCGVKTDGSLACWGNNGDGKATPPSGNDYTEVAAGVRHSCAIRTDGTVTCWGSDLDGRSTPPTTDGLGNDLFFVGIDGWIHTCAVDNLGQAYCWGRDDEGQSSPP